MTSHTPHRAPHRPSRRHWTGWLGWLALASGGVLLGCGSSPKVKECTAFVGVINTGVEKVQKLITASPDASGGSAVEELRTLADEMDTVAQQAEAASLTLPELKKYSGDYQAMAREVAAAARDLATAVDNVDSEKMKSAQDRIVAAVAKEDPLVEEINRFCQTP